MKVISIINCKGGVGKTTVTASIGQALAILGQRVLAIDNDSQHNLSFMLGHNDTATPTVRDLYRQSLSRSATVLDSAIHTTGIPGLELLPSCNELSNNDIRDRLILKKCIEFCRLGQRYDYILIDNPPGMDGLQETAINASGELLVPTELTHFACSGITNLQHMLTSRFGTLSARFRIIPNFYRDTLSQNAYLTRLQELFAGKVTTTTIPFDVVLEECLTDNKILFLHRFQSRATASYLALVQELFDLDSDTLRQTIATASRQRLADEARERYYELHPQSTAHLFPYHDDWDDSCMHSSMAGASTPREHLPFCL